MSTLKFHSHFLHITKLNLNAFKKLVIMSRSNVTFFTNAAKDRIETAAASWADLLDAHKVDIPTIDFNAVNVKEDGFTNEDFTLDKDDKTDTNATAVDQDGNVTVQVGKKELKLFAGDLRRRPPACHRQPSQAHHAQAAKLSSLQAQF